MKRLPLAFFTLAALCATTGMVWGILMARSNDHAMAPAHAHLNLLGWATLALMGAFYALTGDRAPLRLGWVNFALSAIGVVLTIPALALLLGGDNAIQPVVIVGSSAALLGMIVFLLAVLSLWRTPAAA